MQSATAAPRSHLTREDVQAVLLEAEAVRWDAGLEVLDPQEQVVIAAEQVASGFEPAGSSLSRDINAEQHSSGTLVMDRSLVWGVQRVRPFMTIEAEVRRLGEWKRLQVRFDLGIYLLSTPEFPVEHKTVDRFTVAVYDKLALLATQSREAFEIQPGDPVLAAVEATIKETGETSIRIDQTKAAAIHEEGQLWEPGVPRLQRANDLLDYVGYAPLSTEVDGAFVSYPIPDVTTLGVEWVYDTDDDLHGIVAAPLTAHHDYFAMPNRISFMVDDPNLGLPEEGNGLFTYTNADSIAVLGRTVDELIRISAVDQETLVEKALKQANDIERAASTLSFSTVVPNPLHWGHPKRGDIVEVRDSDLKAVYMDGNYEVTSWDLDLGGGPMSLTALRTEPAPLRPGP